MKLPTVSRSACMDTIEALIVCPSYSRRIVNLERAWFSGVAKPPHCPHHRIGIFTFGKNTTDSMIPLAHLNSFLRKRQISMQSVILERRCSNRLACSHAFDSIFICIDGTFEWAMEVRRAKRQVGTSRGEISQKWQYEGRQQSLDVNALKNDERGRSYILNR